jgi:hypothetical protein
MEYDINSVYVVFSTPTGIPLARLDKTKNFRQLLTHQGVPTCKNTVHKKIKKQVKQSRYRPGVAQKVPES